jgi:hypothetical protein
VQYLVLYDVISLENAVRRTGNDCIDPDRQTDTQTGYRTSGGIDFKKLKQFGWLVICDTQLFSCNNAIPDNTI